VAPVERSRVRIPWVPVVVCALFRPVTSPFRVGILRWLRIHHGHALLPNVQLGTHYTDRHALLLNVQVEGQIQSAPDITQKFNSGLSVGTPGVDPLTLAPLQLFLTLFEGGDMFDLILARGNQYLRAAGRSRRAAHTRGRVEAGFAREAHGLVVATWAKVLCVVY
jgi:hypothetical protein